MPIYKKTDYLNPFVTLIDIPDEYFCDRETETAKLISRAMNGNNTVLTAQRRVGKSSLLKHVLRQKITQEKFNTLYVDIYQTKSLSDFVRELSKALLNSPMAKGQKMQKSIAEIIPEIKFYAQLKAGPVAAGMETTVKNQYKETLDKIVKFLESTKKPNIVVLDEFQTIEEYPEKMSAILRTHIQTMPNTRFIFSGSEKHMLQTMFKEENEPFYKSAMPMELDIIPEYTYTQFCKKLFEKRNKRIDDEAIHFAYSIFGTNTLELQQIMNIVFAYTAPGQKADKEKVFYAIEDIIQDNDSYYRELFNSYGNRDRSVKEKNLIQCIAIEGLATNMTSQEMIQNYYLGGASSVSSTLEKLTRDKKAIVTRIGNDHYRLSDKFFELWIADQTGILQEKLDTAEQMFKKERALIKNGLGTKKPKSLLKK